MNKCVPYLSGSWYSYSADLRTNYTKEQDMIQKRGYIYYVEFPTETLEILHSLIAS